MTPLRMALGGNRRQRGCSLREWLKLQWNRVRAVVQAAVGACDREDVPALCGIAGVVCIVHGAALVYEPAGWIVAGMLLLAFYARRA